MARNEELINHIKGYLDIGIDAYQHCYFHREDLEIIIKALEQEPCKDCISREEVIDTFKHWYSELLLNNEETDFCDILRALPSVQPKIGHWIEQDNGNMLTYHRYKCSVCGGKRTGETGAWIQIHDCKWRYCPDCGAKMEE